jgi:predicted DNA-binding protein (UPF0251 family)
MPRPRRFRRIINQNPNVIYFKPAGIPIREIEEVIINLDELEAIRLKDCELLDQKECAEKMEISQPTLHRLLLSARQKIANALIEGKAIKIEKRE